MATSWESDLLVYSNVDGKQFVFVVLPTGIKIPASALKRYRASGPYMPVGFPATKVDDAATWMAAKEKEGFVFVPITN